MHLLLLRTRPTLPWITDFDMTPSKLDFAIDYLVEMVLFVGVSRPLIFVGPAPGMTFLVNLGAYSCQVK